MDRDKLQKAYEAIFLAEFRNEINRAERVARIIALRDSPLAVGLSCSERDAIANKAAEFAINITDEVYFGPSGGKWQ